MKKLVALLLVLVMALFVVACAPNNANSGSNNAPNTPAEHKYNKDLELDANGMGICNICNELVQWIALTAASSDFVPGDFSLKEGLGHRHFYLAEDITTRDNRWLYVGARFNDFCLHLNNKTVTARGEIRLANECTFNIMGKGTVNHTPVPDANTPHTNKGFLVVETAKLNIYGGTYTSEVPIVLSQRWGTPTIKIMGDARISGVFVDLGTVTVDGNAMIDKLEVNNCSYPEREGELGKLVVAKTFTGEIKYLKFPGEIIDNMVPKTFATSTGVFTGKVTTDKGVSLAGGSGTLNVAG